MKQWLMNKPPHEQRIIMALGALLAAALLWFGFFMPMNSKIVTLEKHIASQQSNLDWMLAQAEALTPPLGPKPSKEALSGIVTQSAARSGITVTQQNATAEGLTVTLNPVSFPTLLRWLGQLATEQHVEVVKINLEAGDRANQQVNVRQLTLR